MDMGVLKKRRNSSSDHYPRSLSQPVSARETTSEVLDDDDLELCLSPPAVRPRLSLDMQNKRPNNHTSIITEQPQTDEVHRVNGDYLLLPPAAENQISSFIPLPQPPSFASSSNSGIRQEKPVRPRRNSAAASVSKDEFVLKPFPWATNRRAHVQSLNQLLMSGIHAVSGEVQCKRCEARYEMEYTLCKKFEEIQEYIARNKATMHDRAPAHWMNPALPSCRMCQQPGCVKPVIAQKKRAINWLFLLLGGMLGCCTLEQLKYFCKHTTNHRTGAKDRVLYLTYLGVCKQLAGVDNTSGLFER
ncbi:uncharacterized protein [Aristolochia californica]|uniref:uncharacterized protein n=1 Tax=Aristolochia californica TaxID=171875 RepID=UPI0035E21FB9